MLPLYCNEAAEASHQHKPTCILPVEDLQGDLGDVTGLEGANYEGNVCSTASDFEFVQVRQKSSASAFGAFEAAVQVVTPANRHPQQAQKQQYKQHCHSCETELRLVLSFNVPKPSADDVPDSDAQPSVEHHEQC
jgi:hypothetical protein